jgi:hypothetical protein
MMIMGEAALADQENPADQLLLRLDLIALISFCTGALLARCIRIERNNPGKLVPDPYGSVAFAVTVGIGSIGATLWYYHLAGYNLLYNLFTGSVTDFDSERLAMYSGTTYLAPGYFNQAKNCLLPLTLTAGLFWILSRHPRAAGLYAISAAVLWVMAVGGTGQRTYLIFSLAAATFGWLLLEPKPSGARLLGSVSIIGVSLACTIVFVTANYWKTESPGELIDALVRRIFASQQIASHAGFRYIQTFEVGTFHEWRESLLGLLPGYPDSTLANEIHFELFGSSRGTAPLSIVGSVYLNGGSIFVPLYFVSWGLLCAILWQRFLAHPNSPLRALTYGALFFYLSVFVVGNPKFLIDNGVVTLGLFRIGCKVSGLCTSRRHQSSSNPVGRS